MFMNDPDFDDEFQQHSPGFEYGQAFPSPDSKQRKAYDDERDGPSSYGNAGMGTPQNGRARVLAQQRELLQKKRQSNLLSGGMVRSSLESTGAPSPFRQSTDSQFTPAIPQFSAPRTTTKDPSYDASPEKDSEFTKKSRPSNPAAQSGSASVSRYNRNPRYSDDEDDERANEANRRAADRRAADRRDDRGGDRDRDRQNNNNRRGTEGRAGGRRGKYDSDEDEDDYEYQRRNGNNYGRDSRDNHRDARDSRDNSRGRDNYNRDARDTRENRDREQAPSSSHRSNHNQSSHRDDDSYDDRRGGQSQGKWAGATGGREVYGNNNTAPNSAGTDGRDSRGGYRNHNEVVSNAPQATMLGSSNQQQGARGGNGNVGSAQNSPVPQSQAQLPVAIVAPDLRDMRAFLTSPLPKNNGTLQCYIRRNKSGTNKLFPIYSLYLKEGDVFLMASRKRPKNKTSNYLITMDQGDLHRQGRGYLGKLRSNFVGTEFQVFDNGMNPKDNDADEGNSGNGAVRCELGSVMYAANVLGSRGPRKMQVALPGLDEQGRIMQWKDTGAGDAHDTATSTGDDILTRMKDRNMRDLSYLINKPPRWNEQVGAYVLNFNGRVTMASVKNFQLVDPDEQNAVVLQFGRVGKDEFTMDLQHPISPFQAFAVTLSSFDSKIACD